MHGAKTGESKIPYPQNQEWKKKAVVGVRVGRGEAKRVSLPQDGRRERGLNMRPEAKKTSATD